MKKNLSAIILAGGSGTRLWPISRSNYPKQFITYDSSGLSMFQKTIKRAESVGCQNIIISCNHEHKFHVLNQLNTKVNTFIITEPISKNTAPAISIATYFAKELSTDKDHSVIVMSSDHEISDNKELKKTIDDGYKIAQDNKLIVVGICPTKPHDGYGYIKTGKKIFDGYHVDKFKEKPSIELAAKYVSKKNYFWNSGIFLFKPEFFLNNLKIHSFNLYESSQKAFQNLNNNYEFLEIPKSHYTNCENISIDYAIFEKSKDVACVILNSYWSDLGTIQSLTESLKKDKNNIVNKDAIAIDSENTDILSDDILVACIGIKNSVICVTKDAVLVAEKSKTQDIKDVINRLSLSGRDEHIFHREVHRPWGMYDSLDKSENHQVKRITVKPGAKLSVQRHKFRSEHWVVIKGKALVLLEDRNIILNENESTYIPAGTIHSLENPGKENLELIEVQTGTYFGEDDIERFDDIYGRD